MRTPRAITTAASKLEPEVETRNGSFEFKILLQTPIFEFGVLVPVSNQNAVLPIFANGVANKRLQLEDAFRIADGHVRQTNAEGDPTGLVRNWFFLDRPFNIRRLAFRIRRHSPRHDDNCENERQSQFSHTVLLYTSFVDQHAR